jgi:hypothetical protein
MTNERDFLGSTGKFPDGKLNEDDEGEMRIAVGIEDNCVIIMFGERVSWIGLTAEDARALANSLIEKAKSLES